MADETLVTPKQPMAEVEPTTPQPEPQGGNLPDEVLQMPVFQALFAGAPPAVSTALADFQKRPEAKVIAENKEKLLGAGLALYRSLAGDLGVIFNQLYVSPDDIKAADQAGRLQEIAPPFDAVTQQVGQSGLDNPVLQDRPAPGGLATPQVQTPPQSGSLAAPATPAQNRIVQERAKLLNPGTPTQRGGTGRLLSSILKPVL